MGAKSLMERKCFRCSTMISKLRYAVAVVLAALAGHAADKKPDPSQLISAANTNSDLSTISSHRLTGTVVLNPGAQNESIGSITVYRDQDRYRSEIEISGQHRTWLQIGSHVYVSTSSPIAFMGLEKLNNLENAWREPQANSTTMKFGGSSRKKIQNSEIWCFNAKQRDYDPLHLCFDAIRQVMISTGDEQDLYEFSDFQTLEGRQYPANIRRIKHGKAVLEIRNLHAQLDRVSQNVFDVPQHALKFETCDDIVWPKLISQPDLFPQGTSFDSGESLKIFIYGIVGADGSFGHMQGASIPRNAAILRVVEDAVAKRHYAPAMCGTRAVASESYIEIEIAKPNLR
jgi:hypothetical protein